MRSASGVSQSPSPLKQKYSSPRQVRPGSGTMASAPVVEVLDATDLDPRGVDVDPVVGEEILAIEDERDDHEVAVAEAVGL